MREQFENALTQVADTARTTVNTAVDATQERVGMAGKLVADGLRTCSGLQRIGNGVEAVLNALRLELDQVLRQPETDLVDIDTDLRQPCDRLLAVGNLLGHQRDALPKVVRGYVTDARDALDLVRGAAVDVGEAVMSLREKPATQKAKAKAKSTAKKASKTTKRTARKVARKTPVRKTKNKTKAVANKAAKTVAEVQQST